MKDENAIEIVNMSKDFKVVYDKSTTLKERLLFWNKSKVEIHHVLKDINIEIVKGETVALIGTNGSGKSTLLKLMTKILYPTKGKLETKGKLTSLLELGAGFHPDFTGRENIYFNASIFGLTRTEIENRISDIITFSELNDFIDNPVRTYSSGMYMRLAFSIAINVDADILLIDEILAVGDQHFQEKCFNKLEELRDGHKTIVIVSHDLNSIKRLCNRAFWIYKGNVKSNGKPADIIEEYLEQVAKDYQSTNKDKKVEGIICIDAPDTKKINSEKIVVKGWEMSNTPDTVVLVYLDDEKLGEADRFPRTDVLLTFEDQYGGIATNANAGWEYVFKSTQLGKHNIYVKVIDKDGKLISEDVKIVDISEKQVM